MEPNNVPPIATDVVQPLESRKTEVLWNEQPVMDTGNDPRDKGKVDAPVEATQAVNGVDLSMLDEPAPKPVEQQPIDKLPGFEEFANQFKAITGTDLKEAIESLKTVQQLQAQTRVQAEMQQLQQSWGVDGAEFQSRLEAVKARFSKLPTDLQAKLNNPQGAELIWAKLQLEKGSKPNDVPKFDRSSGKTVNSKALYTRAEIAGMDNKEYAKHADRIAYAYANGLVE